LASARTDIPITGKTIAIGEVGLAGEVRGVTAIERRLTEAARLGYELAVIPQVKDFKVSNKKFENIKVEAVSNLSQALSVVKLTK
jgi:Predicted ATP-dependent serine protease